MILDPFVDTIKKTYENMGIAVLDVKVIGDNQFKVEIIDALGPRTINCKFALIAENGPFTQL